MQSSILLLSINDVEMTLLDASTMSIIVADARCKSMFFHPAVQSTNTVEPVVGKRKLRLRVDVWMLTYSASQILDLRKPARPGEHGVILQHQVAVIGIRVRHGGWDTEQHDVAVVTLPGRKSRASGDALPGQFLRCD
ncbi:MAG: hypothetical protein ABR591_09600 [Candidatus Velthaea sp.]